MKTLNVSFSKLAIIVFLLLGISNAVCAQSTKKRTTATKQQTVHSLKGEYTFNDDRGEFSFVANADGTCTFTQHGKTYYCSWEWSKYDNLYHIWLGSDRFKPRFNGEEIVFFIPVIDENKEWIYIDKDAYRAKHPKKKAKLTHI